MMTIKQFLKKTVFAASVIAVSPLYGVYQLISATSSRIACFQGFSQLLSLAPGTVGDYLRKGFYFLSVQKCSPDCTISFGTLFSSPECTVGKNVYIGTNCMISESAIEDNVLLGSNVHILSGKNIHGTEKNDVPIRYQEGVLRRIVVGEDSWIGNGAIIMARIGKKCVIGAGSIVTRDIGDYSVAAGNPARIIRTRNDIYSEQFATESAGS